jgi:putative N6-adenine-specific DNA methylase
VKPPKSHNLLSAFAVTAPGLEPLCANELSTLGIHGKPIEGGVAWTGSMETVARANLWLRTASRVVLRVAEFKAKAFFELEIAAKKIGWERWIAPASSVEFRVTCRKSKLYHSDAVAQRLQDAVTKRVKAVRFTALASEDEENDPEANPDDARRGLQLFIVRFQHDVCTVSVDTSGALLHMRGYRQALAKAPLRETLAAAVLLGADWRGETPLTDPMCGSGTIPIEAARLARRIAPGGNRPFAFQSWPSFDRAAWTKILDDARAQELPVSPVAIDGSDRDDGAIAAAMANAERAGVASDIVFSKRSISALPAAGGTGLVAMNPPYGVRVGESDALRNLYAQLGNVLRASRPGWTVALLSADKNLERQTNLELHESFKTKNGGIPVHLVTAAISPREERSPG